MKNCIKFKLIILFIFSFLCAFSQAPFGNEWVDFNQKYYNIPVAEDGVYQVTGRFLTDHGVNLDDFEASELQLWYRGREVALLMEDGGDNVFNTEDRFLFYGLKNNGEIDSSLYIDPSYQAHQYYNLFSDTSKYFITWKSGIQGKRMPVIRAPESSNNDVVLHTAHYQKTIIENYSFGREPVSYVYKSQYDLGEGWFSNVITKGRSRTVSFSGINPVSSTFSIEIQLVGRNNLSHNIEVDVGGSAFNVDGFSAADFKTITREFPVSLITNGNLNIVVSPLGVNDDADAISIAYVELTVLENTNNRSKTSNQWFLDAENGNVVSLNNATQTKYVFDITSEYNTINHALLKKQDSLFFSIEDNNYRTYFSFAESEIKTPDYVTESYFEQDNEEYEFIILTHPVFMNGANEYAAYRSSPEGGGYKTRVLSVNRIYDQYAYGAYTPLAIRNYFRYLDKLGHKPKYLFLIGNGSVVSLKQSGRPYYRFINFDGTDYNGNQRYGNVNYMPTMGNPGSDILYTSRLFGAGNEPGIPTGRIGVKTDMETLNYLGKVKEHDNLSYELPWRKRALHLSGGEANEAPYFLFRMNQLGNDFESPVVGGNVETLTKKTDSEVEFFNVSKYVNEGISFLSFIGHSSPSVIEIDIGEVDDPSWGYNNPGKYPVLFLNGCHTGDIYNNNNRSENWLFSTPERGAIAALGHTSYGYSSELLKNAEHFYDLAFNDKEWYKQSLGIIHQQMVKTFDDGASNNVREEAFWPQFAFYGDPTVHLFSPEYSEYIPKANTGKIKSLSGDPVTINSDSVYVSFVLGNYGLTTYDSVEICLSRVYNNGEEEQTLEAFKIPAVDFEREISIKIENPGNLKGGLNEFIVEVNCTGNIPEYNLENNTLNFSYIFNSDAHFNLLPYNYSIEENDTVIFAYHSYNLDNTFQYEFQLDTNRYFANPLATRSDFGKVINFEQKLPIEQDSVIYYWRTRISNSTDVDTAWQVSSFTHINGKTGWGQFNATQLAGNSISGITYSKSQNKLSFEEIENVIEVHAPGKQVPNYADEALISVNGQGIVIRGGLNSCPTDGLYALAFDKTSALPYHTSGDYNGNCGVRPRVALDYNNMANQGQRNSLRNYMSTIPVGGYFLISSSGNSNLQAVADDQELLDMFHEFGAFLIDSAENNKGYIFVGQRGQDKPIFEAIAPTEDVVLREEIILNGKQYKSSVSTNKIGPALQWDSLIVNISEESERNYLTELYEDRNTLTGTELWSDDSSSIALDLSGTDTVSQFYLYSEITDSLNFIYPERHHWAVLYEPVPEAVLIKTGEPENQLAYYENYQAFFEVHNVGKKEFSDSLLVAIEIVNDLAGISLLDTLKIKAPSVLEKESFFVIYPGNELVGGNQISVTLNPGIQKEQSYANNFWNGQFQISGDSLNPLLQATFDGMQINNYDVVSTNPEISIMGTDLFNGVNSISDSSAKITIVKLCTGSNEICDTLYSEDNFFFQDSLGSSWTLQADFREGSYMLTASVNDNSGNLSDVYEVFFSVKEETTFQFLAPYPNPAVHEIIFEADLLGGTDYPEALNVKMYNVTGVLVQEFTKQDFQKINFGKRGISLRVGLNNNVLTSGMYFYVLESSFSERTYKSSGKLIILK